MGKKLTDLGFRSGRKDLDTPYPEELSLVWPERGPHMGPRDFVLSENPELHWFFDSTITDPLDEAHIATALTKGLDKQYIGILQSVGYTKRVKCKCGLVQVQKKVCERCTAPLQEAELFLLVIFGRTRDRIAREANKRIKKIDRKSDDLIQVPATLKDVDDLTAALLRDIENSQRREDKPTDKARRAKYHIEKGSPEDVICKAAGVGTMAAVRNYLKLLEAPAQVQQLVDTGKIPMNAKVKDVEAVQAAVQEHGTLTANDVATAQGETVVKMMTRGQILRWSNGVVGKDSALVSAVLRTVLGTGNMDDFPKLAPEPK